MTNTILDSCTSQKGTIRLEYCRCSTITHTCGYNLNSDSNSVFLYYDCNEDDFSINIYNTIVDSKGNGDNNVNSFCKDGDQYFRCNNMTGLKVGGYQFEASRCLSFSMITVMNCDKHCFIVSGQCQSTQNTQKEISRLNLVESETSNFEPICVDSPCKYESIKVVDSLIMIKNGQIIKYNNVYTYPFTFIKCFLTSFPSNNHVTVESCSTISYDTAKITIYPHFTTGNLCKGKPTNTENAAFGCNVGNCVNTDYCNHTIGFPAGVPQYTTLIHTDIQTGLFTPSKEFTKSSIFSSSFKFTQSFKFTSSSQFTASDDFGRTKKFTPSIVFTHSFHFTSSYGFTKSNDFTKTNHFSESNYFLSTDKPIFIDPGNDGSKGIDKKKLIGIIAGSVGGAAAVVAAGLAVFFIKKGPSVKVEDLPTMNDKNNTEFNVDNDLDDIMHNDDPFADDFANH